MKKPVNRIEKILVSIDFSSYSISALEYAMEVADVTSARVLAVNIINQKDIDSARKETNLKYPDTFLLAKYLPKEIGSRELRLKALIKNVFGSTQMPIKILIGYGRPEVEILKAIDRENADFLVFGPKGRTNLHGFLFGSVAEKLFRHSPIPVMSLRSRPE